MRVLWFSNILPLPVTRKLGISDLVKGGWVDALRLALESFPDLELGIASDSESEYVPFVEKNATFYNIPIPRRSGSIGSVYRRWLHNTDLPNVEKGCINIINEFKPDIIHIHGSESFYGRIVKDTSIPVIISIQGILSVIEKEYFGGYTFKDILMETFSINFIKGISAIHNQMTMKKSAYREREIISACKYFIGRTEFDKNFVSLINPTSHYYHCDEVLRSPFYSAEWVQGSSNLYTIYCTTDPAPYKGLGLLLEACNILKTNGFENIRLRVAGPIQSSANGDFIKRKVKDLNLTREVTWLGKSYPEMIISELKQASVYVLPSYAENSPNSLSEAMLVGAPCIASYVGGVPSEICHGKDGLFFPSGDSYSLAGMIAKILKDPPLAKSLSENAKITARIRHDPQKIVFDILNIYSDIINHCSDNKI